MHTLICVLSIICFRMFVLICVFSHLFSNRCSRMCAFLCVLSYLCSHICSRMCAVICLLSYVCFPMGAPLCVPIPVLSYVCSYVLSPVWSHDRYPFSQFHPQHCLGSPAGLKTKRLKTRRKTIKTRPITKPTKFHRYGPGQSIPGTWSHGIPSALRGDASPGGWAGSFFVTADASTGKGGQGDQERMQTVVLQIIEMEWGWKAINDH